MISESQIRGNINTTDRQLLFDIREELRKLNDNIEKMTAKEPQKRVGRPRKENSE